MTSQASQGDKNPKMFAAFLDLHDFLRHAQPPSSASSDAFSGARWITRLMMVRSDSRM